jgi:16S rRNA (cytidine1402-2'-O)-methyltransferase
LDDITLRALEILKSSSLVLAEDTRHTLKLFTRFDINTPLQPFHQHNEHRELDRIIALLSSGKTIALVSDAGTPSISDPGFLLARACRQNNITVTCLPGATAFVPALVQSGIPCTSFCFEGFLPEKKGRQTLLKKLAEEERTMIFYEAPHRLLKTLDQFKTYFGADRIASVSRELTKVYEETQTATIEELIMHFSKKEVKGELVVIVSGKK